MNNDKQTALEHKAHDKVWALCSTATHFGGPKHFEVYESDDFNARVLGASNTYLGAWEAAYNTLINEQ